ncbi:hypothetical protein [Plantactinospora sp. KLBMP9567]|uniref:hypothetical protein n=1 Tax=Plantactinospora sp. KLBMP9567 TaxID=3085900 RepID=UPI0029827935|nr:hypothetical protein [Plantactinospora sp. KLBMP9567]MDW5323217.1 hypothetical protein [Plantactinospora sp. KLBMP9567]
MFPGRRGIGAMVLSAVLFGAGCAEPAPEPPPEPVRPQWQRLTLPAPAGTAGRPMVRDVTGCADRWYAVGGVGGAAGETRPAAWTSTDGVTWAAMRLEPKGYYGRRSVLYSAACRDGRVAILGDKPGGAHGNPRASSWRQLPDGSLVEVEARFELYGGPTAVNVARLVAGPRGYLIAGNRSSGVASWVSADAGEFEIMEGVPELATDGRGTTWGFDAVATAQGWLMVGGILPPGGRIDRDPLGWTSSDGRTWQRDPVPATEAYEELQRVVVLAGTPVTVGLRGREFGVWRRGPQGWESAGAFGTHGSAGAPAVGALAVTGDGLLAAVSDGTSYSLWSGGDEGRAWRPVTGPVPMPAGADRDVSVFAVADQVLLAVDDGREAALWTTRLTLGT